MKDKLTYINIILIVFVIGIVIGCFIGYYSNSDKNITNNKIDSLNNKREAIKIKVEKLDSIKDAKVIEVSTLNNDSTLKLFYKLVSE